MSASVPTPITLHGEHYCDRIKDATDGRRFRELCIVRASCRILLPKDR